jgi:hypothetical protein
MMTLVRTVTTIIRGRVQGGPRYALRREEGGTREERGRGRRWEEEGGEKREEGGKEGRREGGKEGRREGRREGGRDEAGRKGEGQTYFFLGVGNLEGYQLKIRKIFSESRKRLRQRLR